MKTIIKDFAYFDDEDYSELAQLCAMEIVFRTIALTIEGQYYTSFEEVEDYFGLEKGSLLNERNSKGVQLCDLIGEELEAYYKLDMILDDIIDKEEQEFDIMLCLRFATNIPLEEFMEDEESNC